MVWKLKKEKPEDRIKELEDEPEEQEEEPEEVEEIKVKPKEPLRPVTKGKVKERIVIVNELPVQPVRKQTLQDGTVVTYYTVEEYLTLMANEEL